MSFSEMLASLEKVRDSLDDTATKATAKKYVADIERIINGGLSDLAQDLGNLIDEVDGAKDNLADQLDSKEERADGINDLSTTIDDLISLLRDHI